MWIFKQLCDNPGALLPVRKEAGEAGGRAGGAPDPATRIVMETIRLEQSEFLYRRVNRGFDHEGIHFPAGWLVRFCTHESHRDPAVFAEPDRFDPNRFAGRSYSREEYAPFGADAHGCMGSHIAHGLGRLFVEALARHFDWQVRSDGPVERAGNRHADHWRPSSKLRLVLVPRGSEMAEPAVRVGAGAAR
jgi:cytochrome P450